FFLGGAYQKNCPKMSWTQAPQMKINESVAAALDYLTQIVRRATVWIHIEDGSRVPDQAIGPTRDDTGPDDAYRRVYPEPSEGAGEQQADNYQYRYRGVGDHMNHRRLHVIVPKCSAVRVIVLFEEDRIIVFADPDIGCELMRFWNV